MNKSEKQSGSYPSEPNKHDPVWPANSKRCRVTAPTTRITIEQVKSSKRELPQNQVLRRRALNRCLLNRLRGSDQTAIKPRIHASSDTVALSYIQPAGNSRAVSSGQSLPSLPQSTNIQEELPGNDLEVDSSPSDSFGSSATLDWKSPKTPQNPSGAQCESSPRDDDFDEGFDEADLLEVISEGEVLFDDEFEMNQKDEAALLRLVDSQDNVETNFKSSDSGAENSVRSSDHRSSELTSSSPQQTSYKNPVPDTVDYLLNDINDYEPMEPFARPDFPPLISDRSPVPGLSSQIYLRTCFRIGELIKEGTRCASLQHDVIFELFCTVRSSYRETNTVKQHFVLGDLWHERPPHASGVLANFKTTELGEKESGVFVGGSGKMARCLGKLKKDVKTATWVLHLVHIRETDWEEVGWTKKVICYD